MVLYHCPHCGSARHTGTNDYPEVVEASVRAAEVDNHCHSPDRARGRVLGKAHGKVPGMAADILGHHSVALAHTAVRCVRSA